MIYLNDYIDVYFSRVNHLGSTLQERVKNSNNRSFKKWLAENPQNLSANDKYFFQGRILSLKQSESELHKMLYVDLDIPIKIGDLIKWENEYWIIYLKKRDTNEAFQTFYILRCTYKLKWVDRHGFLQSSWAHFVSSLDSKVKENFRTWNSLITPQPNKYAEVIMPRFDIEKQTKFIVDDEAWLVSEYDKSSIYGVLYLSLTEDKVNLDYDDLENDIGNKDQLNEIDFIIPKNQNAQINVPFEPSITIKKNGVIDEELEYTLYLPEKNSNIEIVDNTILVKKEGEYYINVELKDYKEYQKTFRIICAAEPQEMDFTIVGNDYIRLTRNADYYVLNSNDEKISNVVFSLSDSDYELAILENVDEFTCKIIVNSNNKLGTITLTAELPNSQILTKTIEIKPLW